jgi:hypothetical protein
MLSKNQKGLFMRITTILPLAIASLLLGCGSNSKSKGSIDISEYLPTQDMNKNFLQTLNDGNSYNRNTYSETIERNENQLVYKIDNNTVRTITINENNITQNEFEENKTIVTTMERFVDKGDTLFTQEQSNQIENIILDDVVLGTKRTESVKKCKLDGKSNKLDTYSIPYEGDILMFKCIEEKSIVTTVRDNLPEYIDLQNGEVKSDNDISYFYLKKGVGLIAYINDDCIVEEGGVKKINDKAQECKNKTYIHNFFLD